MRDGMTSKMVRSDDGADVSEFLMQHRVSLVHLSGAKAGIEHEVASERVVLGRGPGVDLLIEDACASRQHAAVEYAGTGFRIRDLGSTNGIEVNDQPSQTSDIAHGDRFRIGDQLFQLVIEDRADEPDVYELALDV